MKQRTNDPTDQTTADLPLIAPKKAATMLGVAYCTLHQYCHQGKIAFVRDSSGRRLFTAAAIEDARRKREAGRQWHGKTS